MEIKYSKDLIDNEIKKIDFGKKPSELYDPMRFILLNGGKRLRPLLTLYGCYLFTDNFKKALKPGIGVEIFHNFTLIHDDIMDQAPLRRGKKTVHEKWNRNIAILSGDTMLIKAYDYLLDVDESLVKKIISLFNRCAIQVCEGQQYDMNFESQKEITEQQYLDMIHQKTATLLGFSLQLGSLIGGAKDSNANLLRDFGLALGTGFQLKDDLLDVYGDSEKFGKQVGGDIQANKKTFLLIQALSHASTAQRETIEFWLLQEEPPTEKVKRVTEVYDQIGVRKLTQSKIDEYFRAGFALLDQVECDSQKKQTLVNFAKTLINRKS